jgi:N-acetyltransferase
LAERHVPYENRGVCPTPKLEQFRSINEGMYHDLLSEFREQAGAIFVNQFELQPHLVGELVELRPLRPDDWDALFAAAADPLIWEQHPASDRYKEEVFRDFFRDALASGGAFVVVDRKTQAIIGSSRYFGYDPDKSEIEIGWSFLARAYWGGRYNAEMKRLMLDHAFRFVDVVVFLVGPQNRRSQKAMEKIGGVRAGTRLKPNSQGSMFESVVYEIRKRAS